MDGCTLRLLAAITSDNLYLFAQGNYIIIGEKLEFLKSDICGNHGLFCQRDRCPQMCPSSSFSELHTLNLTHKSAKQDSP